MIYRLAKWDLCWKKTPLMMLLTVPLGLLYRSSGISFEIGFPLFLIFILLYQNLMYHPCSIFEASLPVHGRQILCARLLARVACIWGVVFAMVLTKLALGRPSKWIATRIALETGAALTLALLSYACYRTGKQLSAVSPRKYVSQIVIGAFVVIGILIFPEWPVLLVVLVFAITAVTLFLYAWVRTPESIQILSSGREEILAQPPWLIHTLPDEAQVQEHAGDETTKITPVSRTSMGSNSLIFRILYSRSYFSNLIMCGAMVLFIGAGACPILFLMIAAVFIQFHNQSFWLFALPVSRHRLFVLILLPAVAISLASCGLHFYVWGIFFPWRDVFPEPRIVVVDGTLLLAGCFLTALGIHTLWWHRAGRIFRAIVGFSCILIVVSPFAYLFISNARRESVQTAMNWFLGLLPNSLWALAALALISLGALYYLASRQFCQLEIPQFQLP